MGFIIILNFLCSARPATGIAGGSVLPPTVYCMECQSSKAKEAMKHISKLQPGII